MKTITGFFNQICAQKYKPLGFVKYRSTFARISGDVIQAFSLKRLYGRPECTVEFGVVPLCLPQPFFLGETGAYELGDCVLNLPDYHSWWSYEPKSSESMVGCVESICDAIDLHVMPYFDSSCDCETALVSRIRMDEFLNTVRQKRLRLLGITDMAKPWQWRSMFDYTNYYMALKTHNSSFAHKYLAFQVDHHTARLKSFSDPEATQQPENVIRNHQIRLAELEEQLERLNAGDWNYFDDMVFTNEDSMRRLFAEKYPRILKE